MTPHQTTVNCLWLIWHCSAYNTSLVCRISGIWRVDILVSTCTTEDISYICNLNSVLNLNAHCIVGIKTSILSTFFLYSAIQRKRHCICFCDKQSNAPSEIVPSLWVHYWCLFRGIELSILKHWVPKLEFLSHFGWDELPKKQSWYQPWRWALQKVPVLEEHLWNLSNSTRDPFSSLLLNVKLKHHLQ